MWVRSQDRKGLYNCKGFFCFGSSECAIYTMPECVEEIGIFVSCK